MEIHGYTEQGSIDATIEGRRWSIIDNMGNRHRQMIAEWEADGNTIPAYVAPAPTKEDVWAERDRRLSLGFDYDFGDERGVHHIATTPGDMVGWQDVTTWATVQAVTGNAEATLPIKTETGPAIIAASEWFVVLNAATAFRQPIWGASFVLEAMNPIPPDFRKPGYWSA